jgi:uncharacterized RDD family membrane protein YckC
MAAAKPDQAAASVRIRLLCMIYEALLLGAILLAASAIFLGLGGDGRDALGRALLQAWLALVMGAYFVWSWSAGRRTLPMRTWRLRLIDRAGEPPSVRAALVRFLAAAITLPLGAAALWWALLDRERLFLHDRIAGTRVVRDPARVREKPASAARAARSCRRRAP